MRLERDWIVNGVLAILGGLLLRARCRLQAASMHRAWIGAALIGH